MVQAVCALLLLLASAVPGHAQFSHQIDSLSAGTGPSAVAVNPVTGKIYVANSGSANVAVIDGASDTFTTVAVGTGPEALAVNPLTNKIYVVNNGNNSVTVIDGSNNTTATVTLPAASTPVAVAVNPVTNKIYVANINSGTVTVIDGSNNSTATVTAGTGASAVAVNPVTNKIYVTNYGTTTVTVIDGTNNSTATVTVGTGPIALAVNPVTNKIYVANSGSSSVTVIDGSNNSTATVSLAAQPQAVAVNPVTNKIYVATLGGNLTQIDGAGNSTRTFGAYSAVAVAVDPVTDRIYATESSTGYLDTIDEAGNITYATPTSGTNPEAIAVNPVTNRVYVANQGSNNVMVFAGGSNSDTPIPVGAAQSRVAVNPVTNKIYATEEGANAVAVIDGTDNFTTTVPVGQDPFAIAVNPVTNRIYVANGTDNTVSVIDGTDDSVIYLVATGGEPINIAVNPVTNRIYVANSTGNSVTVIDGATNFSTQVATGSSPNAVAVNAVTDKIYVTNYGATNVTVIDGATNSTTTVAAGSAPFAVAVNPVTNRIYVANSGSSNVTVIDGATNFTTTVSVGSASIPNSVAVNSIDNKIYVSSANGSSITVIDGATNSTGTVPAGNSPIMVVVNPVTDKIYVSNNNDSDVTVIDGASQTPATTTWTFPAGLFPEGLAVNPITNVIYVASSGENNVWAYSEQEVQPIPLVTTITPLPDNQTEDPTPTFDFSVTSTYFPVAAPADALLFQVDTWQGTWQMAQSTGFDFFSGTPAAPLQVGPHILYAYATDSSEATSIMGGVGSSPIIGGISAYYFLVGPPTTATTTTLTASVNPVLLGHPVTFTAFVETAPPSSTIPQGSVGFFDGATLLETVALVGTGTATYTTSSLTAGTHSISAVYIPSSGFTDSTSNVVSEAVGSSLAFTSANTTTFTVGINGTFTVTTSGTPTPTLSKSGTLPTGVTFLDNGDGTATLSGTPASGTPATYPLTFTAQNGVTPNATQSFTLTVNQAPAITSGNSTTFVVGTHGSFTVTTTGVPTVTTLSDGGASLPGGVTYVDNGNGTGTLAGTPNAGTGGVYHFTFTAQNGVTPNATQSFTLTVDPAPAITSANNTTFTTGVAGLFTVTTTGYPTPSVHETGSLPNGLLFYTNTDGTGTIKGTPAAGTGGVYHITLTASNGIGSNASQSFTLTVNQAPAITSANNTTFTTGVAGLFTVTTTGYPAPSLSESGSLPGGVTFVDNHNGTGTLSGKPTVPGTFPITFTATNSVTHVTQNFSLAVNGLTISPSSLNFGTVYLGSQEKLTATVTNTGASTITITGVTITPGTADASAYTYLGYCSGALNPGKSCTLSVSLNADKVGTLTATLNLADNGPGNPQHVSLTATVIDPVATFSPKPLNFGTESVGSKTTLPLKLTNTGQTALTISGSSIGGTDPGDFSETNNCPSSLAPGVSCTFEVIFNPKAKNSRTAMLKITDNVSGGSSTLQLEGMGK